jgi:hypothetical protein
MSFMVSAFSLQLDLLLTDMISLKTQRQIRIDDPYTKRGDLLMI